MDRNIKNSKPGAQTAANASMETIREAKSHPASLAPARERKHREPYKVVRRRRRKRILKVFLGFLLLLAVAGLVFIFAFRLNTINVEGNSRYTDQEIMDLVGYDPEAENNTLIFFFEHRKLNVEGIPFISSIDIKISGRNTIDIIVGEKIVIGCVENGGKYVYFDNEGYVTEISDDRQADVPLGEGVAFDSLELNHPMATEDARVYDDLLNLTLLLNKYDITIDKVGFDDDGRMVLTMSDIKIDLGDSQNLEDKISELKNIIPQIQQMEIKKGTLHMENYDSTKDSIFFSPES